MKHFLLILLCVTSINLTFCQTVIEKGKAKDIIFTKTEVPPAYPGGEDALRNFYRKNINTDFKPDSTNTLGCIKITVKFIVRKDGSITDAYCENGSACGMCREFIRVIKLTGKWLPALQNGRKVNAYHQQIIIIDWEE